MSAVHSPFDTIKVVICTPGGWAADRRCHEPDPPDASPWSGQHAPRDPETERFALRPWPGDEFGLPPAD
ncbi:hypothetical protein J0H58_21515 [bacterium]|nr:hypothetical protein [bacterium]